MWARMMGAFKPDGSTMRDEDDFQSCPIYRKYSFHSSSWHMASMAAELRTTHVLLGSYLISFSDYGTLEKVQVRRHPVANTKIP